MVDEGTLISKKVSGRNMWRESYGASLDKFKEEMPEPIRDWSIPFFTGEPAVRLLPDSEEEDDLGVEDDDMGFEDDEGEFEDLTVPPTFAKPKPRPRPKYDQDKQLRDTVQRMIDEGEELDWESLRVSFPDVDKATFDNVQSASRSMSSVRSGFEQAPRRSRSRSPPDSEEEEILPDPVVNEPFLPHLEPESDIFRDPTPDPQMYNIPDDWGNDPAPTRTEVSEKGGYMAPIVVGLIFFWLATQAT
jgi:hypothetical protein